MRTTASLPIGRCRGVSLTSLPVAGVPLCRYSRDTCITRASCCAQHGTGRDRMTTRCCMHGLRCARLSPYLSSCARTTCRARTHAAAHALHAHTHTARARARTPRTLFHAHRTARRARTLARTYYLPSHALLLTTYHFLSAYTFLPLLLSPLSPVACPTLSLLSPACCCLLHALSCCCLALPAHTFVRAAHFSLLPLFSFGCCHTHFSYAPPACRTLPLTLLALPMRARF